MTFHRMHDLAPARRQRGDAQKHTCAEILDRATWPNLARNVGMALAQAATTIAGTKRVSLTPRNANTAAIGCMIHDKASHTVMP